jgi:hypothetical protein
MTEVEGDIGQYSDTKSKANVIETDVSDAEGEVGGS